MTETVAARQFVEGEMHGFRVLTADVDGSSRYMKGVVSHQQTVAVPDIAA